MFLNVNGALKFTTWFSVGVKSHITYQVALQNTDFVQTTNSVLTGLYFVDHYYEEKSIYGKGLTSWQ